MASKKVKNVHLKQIKQTFFALQYVANNCVGHLAAAELRKKYFKNKTLEGLDESKIREANKKLANRYLKKKLVIKIIKKQVECQLTRLGITIDWIWATYKGWIDDPEIEIAIKKVSLDQLCKLMNINNDGLNMDVGKIELHFDKQDDGA